MKWLRIMWNLLYLIISSFKPVIKAVIFRFCKKASSSIFVCLYYHIQTSSDLRWIPILILNLFEYIENIWFAFANQLFFFCMCLPFFEAEFKKDAISTQTYESMRTMWISRNISLFHLSLFSRLIIKSFEAPHSISNKIDSISK